MIQVTQLGRSFGDKEALAGVSFSVAAGEAVGYLGPNGAGKSTTVKILAGLLRPTSGGVRIAGRDMLHEPIECKRRLGYVPDSAALYTTLTPHEYLSLVAELYHIDRAAAADRVASLLAAFDLRDAADRQIEVLSRGQRQKVLLIGALIHDPDVLLLDEPLNGLDVNAGLTLRRLLEQLLARGKAILFCSHILEVIERVCSRVIVLDRGKVVADDRTEALLQRTSEGTLEAVFRQLTRPDQADEGARAFLEALARPR